MRKVSCFLLSLLGYTMGFSQNIDYNKIILPESVTEADFSEKLVQLAWQNNPANQELINKAKAAKYQVGLAKWSWLQTIRASGNLNEYTIDPERARTQNPTFTPFFPRYNFGLTVSLGTIFLTPIEARVARSTYQATEDQVNQQKVTLRAEVLTRYQNYLMNQKLFEIQNEVTEDEYSEFLLMEQDFKAGDVTLEEYKESLKAYNEELTKRITLERDLRIAQIALEELIGVRLEDVPQ